MESAELVAPLPLASFVKPESFRHSRVQTTNDRAGERVGRTRWLLALVVLLAGCSRTYYRVRADADTHRILAEKSDCTPWAPPSDFTIAPHPASRFYDPTPFDDPLLPIPAPQLYSYQVPELRPRDTLRTGPTLAEPPEPMVEEIPAESEVRLPPVRLPSPVQLAQAVRPVRYAPRPLDFADDPPVVQPLPRGPVHWISLQEFEESSTSDQTGSNSYTGEPTVAPIPNQAWDDIPDSCRQRMYDFESIREEYRRTYGRDIELDLVGAEPRLALEDIVDLALINSRNYQLRKELLYRVALELSLQRFAYDLKFSANGNGADANYLHSRNGGATVNTLSVPSSLQADKMLLTGGDLLARFANDVVLTFNGPQGFAADVGSTLLFDLSQSILQRDIRLEALTQSERDVVYAARDFARSRKELFTTLATSYYNLIRSYRQVEIDSQNYFSLVRLFEQTEAEYRADLVPRFQVDQIEQRVLAARSSLIDTCNGLEQSLDNLKLSIGLPTETRVNLNLAELEQLTLRDELAVVSDTIRRESNRLNEERFEEFPDRAVVTIASLEVVDRILEAFRLQERLGQPSQETLELDSRRLDLRVEARREASRSARRELDKELNSEDRRLSAVLARKLALIDALVELAAEQEEWALDRSAAPERVADLQQQAQAVIGLVEDVRSDYRAAFQEQDPTGLPELDGRASALLLEAERIVADLDELGGNPRVAPPLEEALQDSLRWAAEFVRFGEAVRSGISSGLVPVEIEVDDAMMTALVLRYELMNERGALADDWRQIKLAGDDLRSVLDLNASHSLRTRADVNRVFDFTFDESATQLRLNFDAPLNRRAQRNSFRRALINYNVALRRLMQLEDDIKLDVRNDLRSLALDQQQYAINVSSAALLSKTVVSTTLEFSLGLGTVRATDILDAQNDYAAALSQVARTHINYIINRTRLFLDLELMTVGDDGFWPELYDEQFQPEPYYQLPPHGAPAYGELPHLLYSKRIRRMEQIPDGVSAVHGDEQPVE